MESKPVTIKAGQFILIKKLLKMLRASLAIEPILANLVAITLGIGILILLNHPDFFPKLGKWHHVLIYIVYGLILLHTLKSAIQSLFISLMVLCVAGLGIGLINFMPDWGWIDLDMCKKLMLLGVLGVGTSIFVMKN